MATTTYDLNELKPRMHGATQVLKQELGGLRTRRASSSLLDHVQAEAYGTHTAQPVGNRERAGSQG